MIISRERVCLAREAALGDHTPPASQEWNESPKDHGNGKDSLLRVTMKGVCLPQKKLKFIYTVIITEIP